LVLENLKVVGPEAFVSLHSSYVLFVCKCVLPPGDNPIAVNKYIISFISTLLH